MVRMVPHISAVSGMTLEAAPAWKRPVVKTPKLCGSISRLLISCSAMWMCAAAVMGSMQASGMEPWPPLPWTVMWYCSQLAIVMPPPGTSTMPEGRGIPANTWNMTAASTFGFSSRPLAIISGEP